MKIRLEVIKDVREICQKHKDEPSPLIVILEEVQEKYGYVPVELQEVISEETGVPAAEIYGVVTFYSFFSLTPKGKYVIPTAAYRDEGMSYHYAPPAAACWTPPGS